MLLRSRSFRRLGGIMLLFAWAPVATANAGPCAVWCHQTGGLGSHHAMVHTGHDHGGMDHSECGSSIASTHCDGPNLLVVTALRPSVPVVPSQAVTSGDPPASSSI